MNKPNNHTSWSKYWNRPEKLFADSTQVEGFQKNIFVQLKAVTDIKKGDTILDYGCGKALSTPMSVSEGILVLLYDKSEYFSDCIKSNYSDMDGVKVLDDTSLDEIKDNSLDYILLSSVLQYLNRTEVNKVLHYSARTLKQGGKLILADIIPKEHSTSLNDITALINRSFKDRNLLDSISSLFRLSKYRKFRKNMPLNTYDYSDLLNLVEPFGFGLIKTNINIGMNESRNTYLAEKLS